MIYQLRLENMKEYCIMKLPIVYEGNEKEIQKYIKSNNFIFRVDKKLLYGGYFVNKNGNVLYIT